jgi:hypothetical protein
VKSFFIILNTLIRGLVKKRAYEELKPQPNLDTYINGLRYLDRRIAVWPPVEELLWSSHKLNVIKVLDEIAAIKKTPRPWTQLLTKGFKPTSETFLKREGSDCSNHALKPSQVAKLPQKDLAKKAQEAPYRWMVQQYVPALREVGEWRVILVGGRIVYTVHTREGGNNNLAFGLRSGAYSLAEMSCVSTTLSNLTTHQAVCSQGTHARGANWR